MHIVTSSHRQLKQSINTLRWSLWLMLTVLLYEPGLVKADSTDAEPVIHLINDSFLPGTLLPSDQPGMLRWKCNQFTKPFDFPLSGVSTAEFPVMSPRPKPTGEYCIELSSGDALYGEILDLTDSSLKVQASNAGAIHVKRDEIQRIYRWKETALIYLGPTGLDGWSYSMPGVPTGDIWTSDGGWPRTSTPQASLFRDFGLPARSAIEFEVSWTDTPDFELALGPQNLRGIVDANDQAEKTSVNTGFRFEVWDGELVVMGESERDADVASVTPIAGGPGAVRIQLYLDQERQQLSIFARNGQLKASVRLHARKPQIRSGLRLTNRKGDIRLKHLRIAHWDGLLPRDVQTDKSRIHHTDGTITYGQVTAFDRKSGVFTMRDGKQTAQLKADTISDIFLSPASETTQPTDKDEGNTDLPPSTSPPVRIVYQDGSRFSGQLSRIQNQTLHLTSSSVLEPLHLPIQGLRSIGARVDRKLSATAHPKSSERSGRLELDGARIQGRLVDAGESPEASCLVWHPDFSSTSSPLAKNQGGRVVYREPPKPKIAKTPPAQNRQIAVRQLQLQPAKQGFGDIFKQLLIGKAAPAQKPKNKTPQTLHLRSGDTIPCEVLSIDEEGLHFTTPHSDATFVENARIKGIELKGQSGSPTLDETKRKRLLTLPRLQKQSPPTHLIHSTSGDFLRGRLISMTEQTLTIEVRLSNREIPRDRISQVIWLHEDELESVNNDESPKASSVTADNSDTVNPGSDASGSEPPDRNPQSTTTTRVQTLVRNKDRLTFHASQLKGSVLYGNSDILGECRADLYDVDQLLIGSYIEQAAAQLAYHRWKLHYAAEPKFVLAGSEDSDSPPVSGTESPLVGQPAPDFTLANLAGSDFQLAEHRGDIIVLDFWATWCGPCLQTMPLIDEVVQQFPDQQVRLIAINMEEQPAEIRSTLERHKLNVPVVLDTDGVAAARYSVTSIPQTVVIDREGKIARLFVGGGPKIVPPLRKALEELTDSASSDAATEEGETVK